MSTSLTRRKLLTHSTLAIGAGVAGSSVQAKVAAGSDPFEYEVTRTDEEWLELLGPDDYDILRGGATEVQFSHPLWQEKRVGDYHCKACDLQVYTSDKKYFPEGKGWVFFTAGLPNTQLMSIDARSDEIVEMTNDQQADELNEIAGNFFIEAHCRRCGSHHGHVLGVAGRALHCINGAALVFNPAEA